MEEYINFIPSKKELYNKTGGDLFYLFLGNKVVVRHNLRSLTRKSLKEDFMKEKFFVLGGYKGVNCYFARLDLGINLGGLKAISLREYGEVEGYEEFLLASKALMLLNHIDKNKKCGVCGRDMESYNDGRDWNISCPNCGNVVWPINSLAVIVAISKKDKLLLAHNSKFPEGMYSLIAGFVEVGETLEDCIKREVMEEVGIRVKNIKYFSSQPWAFPNSMMVGFTAEYLSGEIKVDNREIVHAGWFTREEVEKKYRKSISIASKLIKNFMDRDISLEIKKDKS